jgi:hypothetical protein
MRRKLLSLGTILALAATGANAELVQQFKNPSFSGANWSSHVLTIEQIEKGRRDAIDAQKKAELAAADAAAQNTPMARFMNLFSSQVYAQLATQLSNNLFKDPCKNADGTSILNCSAAATTGVFTLDGNTVTWVKGVKDVTLTVVDAKGTKTVVVVPIASFGF